MTTKMIHSGDRPVVTLEVIRGNLELKGWDRPEILLKSGSEEELDVQQDGEQIQISCSQDLMARLPQDARLTIEQVNGGARIKYLEQAIKIAIVSGSLELRDVGPVDAEQVAGELIVRRVAGDLRIASVGGNAIVRDVEGACSIEVGGELDGRDLEGDVHAIVGGNARLRLALLLGKHYQVAAGGEIHCRIPEDASLKVGLTSGAQDIQVRVGGDYSKLSQSSHQVTMAGGQAEMKLTAGGGVILESREVDWGDQVDLHAELADQVAEQVEGEMRAHGAVLDQQMEELHRRLSEMNLPGVEVDRILERTRQATERSNQRAQDKLRRAQDRMQRKIEAAARKAELKARAAERRSRSGGFAWNFEWRPPVPGEPPRPETPQVSDEERLMILRMLQEKKISVEEAELLLAALEGRSE
jgi:hypothetical protein